MRILLVDDEHELVTALSERLEIRGFVVDCAETGNDALDMASKNEHEVAILDVKMPGLSGLMLMERLAKIQPGMRFIFLTGHGCESDYRACEQAGVCSYIMKPVKIDSLVERIREAAAREKGS